MECLNLKNETNFAENIIENERMSNCDKQKENKRFKRRFNRNGHGNYIIKKHETTNDSLFEYYKAQKIVPENEWKQFQDILTIPLPSSFRIQQSLPERDYLLEHMKKNFFTEIAEIQKNDQEVCVPVPIPFVPYAFQTNMPRAAIRSHPVLKNLHELLVNETAIGNVSRQEAVSMVPPLLLDIQPHHFVLDACASPGSKTMQIIELMHKDNLQSDGLLVANDIEYERCYLLVHQTLKRLPTANCVVVNEDASYLLPIIDKDGKVIYYDRILCDVICSSDGTFRKNPELWVNWNPLKSLHLHKLQQKIARRCINLLKTDGLMVYSTCSLNPIEDEAIVAHMLRVFKNSLKLVDVSSKLPELKRSPGISTWKVFNNKLQEFSNMESVPIDETRYIVPSMFPPTEEESKWMNLNRTFRILPHSQNSGGFFVAVFCKTASTVGNNEEGFEEKLTYITKKPLKKTRRTTAYKENPFVFFDENQSNLVLNDLHTHYGVNTQTFPIQNILVRTIGAEKKNALYYVNDALREFLKNNTKHFKIVNAGVPVFRRVEKVSPCPFRLCQDGLRIISPFITKRSFTLSNQDIITILNGSENNAYLHLEKLNCKKVFENLDCGSVVLKFSIEYITKEICAWIGSRTISAFISREEKIHLLELLGANSEKFRKSAKSVRQQKADGGRSTTKQLKTEPENDEEIKEI